MSEINADAQPSVDILNDNVGREQIIQMNEEVKNKSMTTQNHLSKEMENNENSVEQQTENEDKEATVDKNENVNEKTVHEPEEDKESTAPMVTISEENVRPEAVEVAESDKMRENTVEETNIQTQIGNNNVNEEEKSNEQTADGHGDKTCAEISKPSDAIQDADSCQMDLDVVEEKGPEETNETVVAPKNLETIQIESTTVEDSTAGKNAQKRSSKQSKKRAENKDEDLYESLRTEEIISLTQEQPNELTNYKPKVSEEVARANDEMDDENCELVSSEGLVVGSFKKPQNILESVQDTELVKAIRCAAFSPDLGGKAPDDDEEVTEILDKVASPKQVKCPKKSSDDSKVLRGSLGLLAAQYNSESEDSDGGNSVEIADAQDKDNYRTIEVESSSSESEVEIVSQTSEVQKIIDVDMIDDDDEENSKKPRGPLRAKGEVLLEDLPPIQDLQITVPEYECVELGKVHSIVDQLVLVDSIPGTVPLNLDTVLFLEQGKKVLGEVFDVLGQVSNPLYCVRFNSNQHIKDRGIEVGQTVYVAPRSEHTQFVVLPELMKMRGSDASWEHDIEPSEKYLDYSDDEEERRAKISQRNKNRPTEEIESTKKQRVTPGANRSHAIQFDQQNRYIHPSPQYRPPYAAYQGSVPQYPPYQQFSPAQYNYNEAGSSWHANYEGSQFVRNPFARPPFVPSDAMQSPLFPPPSHQPK